jgi:general secretion pathway protein I
MRMKLGGGGAGCVRRGGGCGHGLGYGPVMSLSAVQGFTLIEVLIALAIVAIAMGAVLRAIGSLAADTDSARAHLLALWSADNALSELRITSAWPEPGQKTFACPQGAYRFVCRQVVTALPSPIVRQVTVSVYPSVGSRGVLAEVVTVIQNEAHY